MLTSYSVKIQTVSELTRSIRGLLETEFPFVTVSGEISNLRRPFSGHYYFTLKDQHAQLKSVIFKLQQRYLAIDPEDGLEVVCRGRITVYEPRGDYQFLIDSLEPCGEGRLQLAFEKLKNDLAAEGLFDESRKKSLPYLPAKISLITSPEGAAVHDFIHILNLRYPGLPLEIYPVRVQGDAAPHEITSAIRDLNERKKSDVIVLCRGGGSLEDLWAFNEEIVARGIFDSDIPIVSAVGHEIDFTIADFVADMRAPTPTAAAEMVVPLKADLFERINRAELYMERNLNRMIQQQVIRLEHQKRRLGDPTILVDNYGLRLQNFTVLMNSSLRSVLSTAKIRLGQQEEALKEANPGEFLAVSKQKSNKLEKILRLLIISKLQQARDHFVRSATLLDAVSPLTVLGRGYSITMTGPERRVVRNSKELSVGTDVSVVLAHGGFTAKVTGTKKG